MQNLVWTIDTNQSNEENGKNQLSEYWRCGLCTSHTQVGILTSRSVRLLHSSQYVLVMTAASISHWMKRLHVRLYSLLKRSLARLFTPETEPFVEQCPIPGKTIVFHLENWKRSYELDGGIEVVLVMAIAMVVVMTVLMLRKGTSTKQEKQQQ